MDPVVPVPPAVAVAAIPAPEDLIPPVVPELDLALQWIGFDNVATRNRLREEGFVSFDDLRTMKEKDIRDLAESYGRRTQGDGRFIFGVRRIRYLIGMIHWVQDFSRIGEVASLEGFDDDPEAFREALGVASERAEVRKIEKDQSDTVSKAADPGKFKDERKWPEWEPAFMNYLSTIPGVSGVPLSYVVRERDVAEADAQYESFNERAIACAPLIGATFQADARKVHQLLKSFLQTESAEQWIKSIARKQSGRADMIALRNHYSGEGNTSRRIAIAEKTRETLHYKSERAMSFSSFLDKLQKMFNIFTEENEEITEPAKVRMLLKKVEHPQLQDAIGALRVRSSIEGITFTECANHLAALVSELPDQQSARKIAGTGSDRPKKKGGSAQRIRGGGDGGSKRKGIHMPDGSIWTGFYAEWDQLSKEDRQTVIDTRLKNKAKGGRGKGRQVSEVCTGAEKLKTIKSKMAELQRTLASIKAKQNDNTGDDDDDSSHAPDNAGDSFGGRQKKKQRKE